MAVRRESVRLELDDAFTSGMARATAATIAFKRALNDLDGTKVRTGLVHTEKAIENVGKSSRKSDTDINKLTGRLRLLTDAAVTLGPALVPLGAATIPVLTGALAGLGAAAGGIGAMVLAFNGLGDGIKALDKYRLEPTVDNLQAVRLEMEKLGPAGADFARYIANLEPELRDLQNVARAGIFPGLEDGINALLADGPQITSVIAQLSEGVGTLARQTGESLGGPAWEAFFDYLETDARPTLEAFGHSIGNLSLGLANLLVAFAPLTRDFTGGLEDMTRAFAEWSANLDTNASFQEFVAYVRESGPQAVEFLGAIAQAFAGLVEAAAPFGTAVLPGLTALAKIFGAIAGSPLGPYLYTAAAGFLAIRRGADLSASALGKFNIQSEQTRTSLSRYGGMAFGVLAVGTAVGAMADNINRIDPSKLDRSLTALGLGQTTAEIDKIVDSLAQLNSPANKVDLGEIVTVGGLFGDSSLDKFANNVDQIDVKLANLVETGQQVEAAGLFEQLRDLASARGVDPSFVTKQFDDYALALQNLGTQTGNATALQNLLVGPIREVGGALNGAASGAEAFSGALAKLNGWFDKRDAVRAYKDSIDTLRESLKDGFQREDAANIDAIGRSILQVAEGIKNPGRRADFLLDAKQQLVEIGKQGPKTKAQVDEIIAKFEELGLMKPEPKITADDRRALQSASKIKTEWGYLDRLVSEPKIEADPGDSIPILSRIRGLIADINDKTVTITVNRRGGVTSDLGGRSVEAPAANGTTVPKTGLGYADRHLYLLADGEEVISNRHGQADRHRSLLKAINANRLAAGGTTGADTYVRRSDARAPEAAGIFTLGSALSSATASLHLFQSQLTKSEKALDRERSALETLTSQRDSLSSATSSALLHDPFGNGLAGLQAQVAADSADSAAMLSALQQLVRNGIDPKGALFQALAASGDVTTAQQLAQLSSADLFGVQAQFADRGNLSGQVGSFAGNQAFGDAIRLQTKATDEQRDATKELRSAVRSLEQEIKQIKHHVKDGAHEGTREGYHEGVRDRNNYVAASVATSPRGMGGRR